MGVADRRADVVVVGAGAAGAMAAWGFASAGYGVILVDARPLVEAGARWVNGVPPWIFDHVELDRPEGEERCCGPEARFTVVRPSGERVFSLAPSPVWSVDMRRLTARIQGLAIAAGVEAMAPAAVRDVRCVGGRLSAVVVATQAGPCTVAADLFVDASGMGGALRRRHPLLARDCPKVARTHICSAAQYVCRIMDLDAARRHLDRFDARPGETLSRVGVSGGWSVANLACDLERETVDLLTGAIATSAYAGGSALIGRMRAASPWIGPEVFGGRGAIPLRRPYDRLVAPGLALLGDAACQVFSMHGSGVGMGLLAARLLTDAVGVDGDPGALTVLWRYQARFHRRWGGLLAAYDIARRATQALAVTDVEAMLDVGIIDSNGFKAGLEQRLPAVTSLPILNLGLGMIKKPRLFVRLRSTAKIPSILRHYRRYPDRPDDRRLASWSARAARHFGEAADVGQR